MKLTKHLKSLIVQAAVKRAGVVAKETQVRLDYAKWVEDTIAKHREMPIDEIQHRIAQARDILRTIPGGYAVDVSPKLRTDSDQTFNVGGQRRTFYMNGCTEYNAAKAAEMIYKAGTASTIVVDGDGPTAQALYDIDARKKAVEVERRTIEANVEALLDTVSTDAQLLKVCPEFKTLLDEVLPTENKAAGLPALQITELVKMVGLP